MEGVHREGGARAGADALRLVEEALELVGREGRLDQLGGPQAADPGTAREVLPRDARVHEAREVRGHGREIGESGCQAQRPVVAQRCHAACPLAERRRVPEEERAELLSGDIEN